jgi:integrase
MAVKVFLRKKLISGGLKQSLYLDFIPAIPVPNSDKRTRREFLGKYLFTTREEIWEIIEKREMKIEKIRESDRPDTKRIRSLQDEIDKYKKLLPSIKPLSQLDREYNKSTLKIAQQIKYRRENQLSKPEIYDDFEREQLRLKELGQHDFVAYFRELAEKRSGTNYSNWNSALLFLEEFARGVLRFADLDETKINDFREFLQRAKSRKNGKDDLSNNTAVSYFNKVKAALKQAYKEGRIQTDINARIDPIKVKETRRTVLSLEEINRLAKADCKDPVLKRAGLFSALTGIRHCDIRNLQWKHLEHVKGSGYFLLFVQQKTEGVERMPISDQAVKLMGARGHSEGFIFPGLKGAAYHSNHLKLWMQEAGISKHITFHCFRHTYATLQLEARTDIYTISKMLGHKSLRTTQIYTHVVDKLKKEATKKIRINLDE